MTRREWIPRGNGKSKGGSKDTGSWEETRASNYIICELQNWHQFYVLSFSLIVKLIKILQPQTGYTQKTCVDCHSNHTFKGDSEYLVCSRVGWSQSNENHSLSYAMFFKKVANKY